MHTAQSTAETRRVLYLTGNPNLGSTTRILQSWLHLGRHSRLRGIVAVAASGDFANWLKDEGIESRTLRMPVPSRRWPIPVMWHAGRMAFWAIRRGVQVIHCNEHDVYPFALLLRRMLNKPIVCHVRFRIDRPYCDWAFRGTRAPDALLWTSEQQRSDCRAALHGLVPPDRQAVVPLGLDLDQFGKLALGREQTRRGWGVGPNDILLGTASALRPIKRIHDFIELCACLGKRDPRFRFVLAGRVMSGDEEYGRTIIAQIRKAGLGNRFLAVGHQEPVEPFLHALDIFVSTSEYETFGNSVCEAMACGRPVVAYRGGSVHEVVGEAGRIVETGNLTALIAASQELADSPLLRVNYGALGRRRVAEHFNPAKSLTQLLSIYEKLAPLHGDRRAAQGAFSWSAA